jgi:hypothetical protein
MLLYNTLTWFRGDIDGHGEWSVRGCGIVGGDPAMGLCFVGSPRAEKDGKEKDGGMELSEGKVR